MEKLKVKVVSTLQCLASPYHKKTGVPLEKLSNYFPIKKFVMRKKLFNVTTTLACGRPPTASLQLFPGFLAPRAHLRLLVAADIKVFGGFRTI